MGGEAEFKPCPGILLAGIIREILGMGIPRILGYNAGESLGYALLLL